MWPEASSSFSWAAGTGTLFSSRTTAEQVANSSARVGADSRTARQTKAKVSRRAIPIAHPFCLGLKILDYGLLGRDVFLRLKVLMRPHSHTGTRRGRPTDSITRVKLRPP